ncbi:Glycosyltransferase involved in cell wall bisynthesis [Salinihabitans flavidus]|uniref:Glycosyltransferase involved in cell wall bisynthesis n=1 Tax=Salinihabitans flavidus TaxID=569882 RepID=A0A1H8W309_9RHOB|nr:glycosyltransferase [Salinihabitans flavidus]SEP22029.1 Glycosyltransferase involved in cell wall bisynthesis [Salinihabitans flavidus]
MTKPRILLCPDIPNWAYDNICDQIVRQHSDKYDFERYYMAGSVGYPEVFLNQVFKIMDRFDVVHFFWREDVQHMLNPETLFKASSRFQNTPEALFEAISGTTITASVYDHLFLEPRHFPWRERAFSFMDGYSVSSGALEAIYSDIECFGDPLAVIPDGVDTNRFQPANLERLARSAGPLTVGWVGNSAWGNDPVRDAKGLNSILIPAIDALKADGHDVVSHFADSTVQMRNHAEMVSYYGEIDVLVCSSEIEGTPNPVLEAMASGVPVVSTRVGIVPDVFGPLQSEFILPERTIAAMTEALKRLLYDRALLPRLSEENLEQISNWTWEETTRNWPKFWQRAIERYRGGRRGPLKRHLLRERYSAWYCDHIKYKDHWKVASGPATPPSRIREGVANWVYRSPRRLAVFKHLLGRL